MLPYFFSAHPVIFRSCVHAIPVLFKASPILHVLSLNLSLSLSLSLFIVASLVCFLSRRVCEVDAAIPNVSVVQRALYVPPVIRAQFIVNA